MSKWIYLNTNLPPYEERVLICTTDHEVVVGYLDKPQWKTDQAIHGAGTILCWQPLGLQLKPVAAPRTKNRPQHIKVIK